MMLRSGQPKVKLTTGTGLAMRSVTFAGQSSSSHVAAPGAAPTAAASAARLRVYLARAPLSAEGAPGRNTLTPNGPPVAARTASMPARIACAV